MDKQSIYSKRELTTFDINTFGSAALGIPSSSGTVVNEITALGVSAIWCAVNVIASSLGSLPLQLFALDDDGNKKLDRKHPVAKLLRRPCGEECTKNVFIETLVSHAVLYGTGFAEIQWGYDPQFGNIPIALWSIHPRNMRISRTLNSQTAQYDLTYSIILPGLPERKLSSREVFVLPGLTPDCSVGYSMLLIAANTIGGMLSTSRYAHATMKNAVRPSGALEVPDNFGDGPEGDKARENLMRSWQGSYSGDRAGNVALLEDGVKFTPFIAATNEQNQLVEMSKFWVYEASRLTNVPPCKLHSLEKSNYATTEAQNQDFLDGCLRFWQSKFSAECEMKLFAPEERDDWQVSFDNNELLKADQAARYQSYQTAVGMPFLTVNEARQREGYNPLPNGDTLMFPLNHGINPASPESMKQPQDTDTETSSEEADDE